MEYIGYSNHATIYIVVLILLIVLSAIISMGENALRSLSKAHIEELESSSARGSRGAILKLNRDSDRLAYVILLASNLVNIAIIICASSLINTLLMFGDFLYGIIFQILVISILLLILVVYIPRSFSTVRPLISARFAAPLLLVLMRLLWPITSLLMKFGGRIAVPNLSQPQSVSIEQLQSVIEVAEDDSGEDKKLLSGIVGFIGREVSAIMRPRVDVVAIELKASFSEVISTIQQCNHSRIPVYGESFDNIEGMLFVKDLLPYVDEQDNFEWHRLLRKAYIVPQSKKINDLLEDFQSKRQHFAVVVDEYGGTLGIVTLEDILEEIVGEISDETDTTAKFYKEIAPGTYLFDGSTHLTDFAEVLYIDRAEMEQYSGNADTLAGLMMELRGEFFKEGESVKFQNYILLSSEVERYRITKVLVTRDDTDI